MAVVVFLMAIIALIARPQWPDRAGTRSRSPAWLPAPPLYFWSIAASKPESVPQKRKPPGFDPGAF
jgi:hypothetical protein